MTRTRRRPFGAMLLAVLFLMSLFSTTAFASDLEEVPDEEPAFSEEPVQPSDTDIEIEVIPETEIEHTEHSFNAVSWASLNMLILLRGT